MTKISFQYDILNYTPASASPVEANFDRVEQHVNQELIERDGTVAMRAQLRLVGDPVANLDAAPKQYVDQVLPIAVIMMYGGAGAPPGGRWALCNGAELQTASYPTLYAIIGNSFSPPGTPAGRFNLPNMLDRVPLGAGWGYAVGASGGTGNGALASHSHVVPSVTSNAASANHVHNGADHYHPLTGISTAGASVRHNHTYLQGALTLAANDAEGVRLALAEPGQPSIGLVAGNGDGAAEISLSGESVEPQASVANTGADTPDHVHTWGAQNSGPADRVLVTTANGSDHTHVTGAFNTEVSGGASTGTNLPPFCAVSYIMRIS